MRGWEQGGFRLQQVSHWGGGGTLILTPTPLNFLGPRGWGEGGWGPWGGLGRPVGVTGTPTYVPQNDPFVALIILNTHMWALQKKFIHWGSGPSSQILGGGGVRGEEKFPGRHKPPPLETHFFEVLREVGGGGGNDPPFFWVENHESFGFFRF